MAPLMLSTSCYNDTMTTNNDVYNVGIPKTPPLLTLVSLEKKKER